LGGESLPVTTDAQDPIVAEAEIKFSSKPQPYRDALTSDGSQDVEVSGVVSQVYQARLELR
jgi:hypothetical protein